MVVAALQLTGKSCRRRTSRLKANVKQYYYNTHSAQS
jgi:hypothetical protein